MNMKKYFSIFLFLVISNFTNNSLAASANIQPSSTEQAIQQAEASAARDFESQLPRGKPKASLPNTNNVVTAPLPPPLTNTQPPKQTQTPAIAGNPAVTPTPQPNPWSNPNTWAEQAKPNSWAEQAKQNPWANKPLPPAPNTNPNITTTPPGNTLPPPPNIFTAPSVTPAPAAPTNQPATGQSSPATPPTNVKQP